MTDFVEILNNYCTANNFKFVYGRKASLNLLDNRTALEPHKIYLMCEPFRRVSERTAIGKIKSYLFNGSFFLAVNSNIDMPVFNEVGNSEVRSKYILNIKPLLDLQSKMVDYFSCTDIEIVNWDVIDVYDIFDQNKDGILVTFSVRSNVY